MSAALHDLYEKAGSPTLRTMEQRAGNFGVLPHRTVHRIVTKQAMPHSKRQFQAYLQACEVPETEWPSWEAAWTRAWRHEKQDDFAARGLSPVSTPLRDLLSATETAQGEVVVQAWAMPRVREQAVRALAQHERLAIGEDVTHNVLRQLASEGVTAPGGTRQPSAQMKRREQSPSQKRRSRRAARQRPVQGELNFTLAEPASKPAALF
ncbi:hypothetical protein C6376_40580 [Streptomyces sp. P3]|uniref:hypothetical protein n=1 Tax=Streptomyces sp. P3 TaxID=2135430 RepID=UPI000D19BFAA|nr:hypothetical protein [Streptomyces sp. P3]AVV46706.1 hypothetical protein C6376_40580 [Streptomyces sp. P3]